MSLPWKSRFSTSSPQDLSQHHLVWGKRGTKCPVLAKLHKYTVTVKGSSIRCQDNSLLIKNLSSTGLERDGEPRERIYLWQKHSVVASSQPEKLSRQKLFVPSSQNIFLLKGFETVRYRLNWKKHPGIRDFISNWNTSLCLKGLGNVCWLFPRQVLTKTSETNKTGKIHTHRKKTSKICSSEKVYKLSRLYWIQIRK